MRARSPLFHIIHPDRRPTTLGQRRDGDYNSRPFRFAPLESATTSVPGSPSAVRRPHFNIDDKVENLTKRYAGFTADQTISSARWPKAQVLGFLCPNGAGQEHHDARPPPATCPPARARVQCRYMSLEQSHRGAPPNLGYLPENLRRSIPTCASASNLKYRAISRACPREVRERAATSLELCNLALPRAQLSVPSSKGYRQRVGAPMPLVPLPDLLILDETDMRPSTRTKSGSCANLIKNPAHHASRASISTAHSLSDVEIMARGW